MSKNNEVAIILPIEQVPTYSVYDDMAICAVYIGHFLNVLNAHGKYGKDCKSLRMSNQKTSICANLAGSFYDKLRDGSSDAEAHLEAARDVFRIPYNVNPGAFTWKHLIGSCRALHSFAKEAGYVL